MSAPSTVVADLSEPDVHWRCFHCGQVFRDERCAADHFGMDEYEPPVCIQAATETQQALIEDRREWRRRAFEAEGQVETLEHQIGLLSFDTAAAFHGARSLQDARNLYESMEGRALAAEDALAAAPRWLARFLRQRAERLWHARQGARS